MLTQAIGRLELRAPKPGLFDITGDVSDWLDSQRITRGLLTIFCAHTSASLLIQENAAPAARRDLQAFFERLAPEDPAAYEHDDEGADDMPAHIRSALTHTNLTIPVENGRMALGTWQGIFLFEHRREASLRRITLHLLGE
jgi:secondary thiamine-phosphate synthase enzyme